MPYALQALLCGLVMFAALASANPDDISAEKKSDADIISSSIKKLNSIVHKKGHSDCEKCVSALEFGHDLAKTAKTGIVTQVMTKFCKIHASSKYARDQCDYKFGLSTVNGSAFGDDITNVLTLIEPKSIDSQYICHHFLNGACPLPETPSFDLSSWWPKKPEDARQPDPSGETFNVIHISDFHVDLDYEIGTEAKCSQNMCCNSWKFNEDSKHKVLLPAQAYGSYQCDAPDSLLQSSLSNVADVGKDRDFEFAIFTGDMVDHDDIQYLSMENAIETEKLVYSSMKTHLNIPVYVTLGNHDTYPYAQIAQEKSGFVNRFSWNTDLAYDMWTDSNWMTEKEAANVKEHYAGFAVTNKRGLRVISLNANMWFLENYYNYWQVGQDPDPSGLFRFLSDQLLECEKQGLRAWVMAHVPMGGQTGNAFAPATQVFTQIIERFSPHVVAGVFFGHTHRDEFQILYSKNATEKVAENAVNVAFLDESITPYKWYNPGWRYYEVDAKTFQITNIHHYYMKLNETFTEVPSINDTETIKPVWEYSYSSRDAYDPKGQWPKDAPLNATFWHNVANMIRDDSSYRQLYLDYSYRHSPYVPTCDDGECIKNLYCYVTSFTVPQVIQCLAEDKSSTGHHILAILGSIVLSTITWIVLAVVSIVVAGTVFIYFRFGKGSEYQRKPVTAKRGDYVSLN